MERFMKCDRCKNDFLIDELDSSNQCYLCANQDSEEDMDYSGILKEFIENIISDLATAKNITSTKLKSDLVAEYAIKHPEKYAKNIFFQSTKKKIKINN